LPHVIPGLRPRKILGSTFPVLVAKTLAHRLQELCPVRVAFPAVARAHPVCALRKWAAWSLEGRRHSRSVGSRLPGETWWPPGDPFPALRVRARAPDDATRGALSI